MAPVMDTATMYAGTIATLHVIASYFGPRARGTAKKSGQGHIGFL